MIGFIRLGIISYSLSLPVGAVFAEQAESTWSPPGDKAPFDIGAVIASVGKPECTALLPGDRLLTINGAPVTRKTGRYVV